MHIFSSNWALIQLLLLLQPLHFCLLAGLWQLGGGGNRVDCGFIKKGKSVEVVLNTRWAASPYEHANGSVKVMQNIHVQRFPINWGLLCSTRLKELRGFGKGKQWSRSYGIIINGLRVLLENNSSEGGEKRQAQNLDLSVSWSTGQIFYLVGLHIIACCVLGHAYLFDIWLT